MQKAPLRDRQNARTHSRPPFFLSPMVACSQTGSGREEKTKSCSSPEKATTLEQEEATMCGIGSCQVPMANGSANQPEASGQLPLAKLVAERRREMGLTLAEVCVPFLLFPAL